MEGWLPIGVTRRAVDRQNNETGEAEVVSGLVNAPFAASWRRIFLDRSSSNQKWLHIVDAVVQRSRDGPRPAKLAEPLDME